MTSITHKKWFWFVVALVVISLDQLSKHWVLHTLIPYQPNKIMPGLSMTLAFNAGSAFGFLSQAGGWQHWFFTGFSLLMSVGLSIWMCNISPKAITQLFGLSLILGGALGNAIDRLLFGYVIDFIDVYYKTYHWPVFNLADSAICVGAVILFFSKSDTLAFQRERRLF